MRGFGGLIIMLIGVFSVYAIYWVTRAVSAAQDGAYYLKQTGNIKEALSLVKFTQSLPDDLRLSAKQLQYIESNETWFWSECRSLVEDVRLALVSSLSRDNAALPQHKRKSEADIDQLAKMIAIFKISRQWCLAHQVS